MQEYYANGKLLLTGEYLILDGAIGIALPTKFGQSMLIKANETRSLNWTSLDHHKNTWFQYTFSQLNQKIPENPVAERLRRLLQQAKKQNPHFLQKLSFDVCTTLTFPNNWGLGTSSTLIYLLAKWADCDPFELLFNAFGGSGYDIACAGMNTALSYQLVEKNKPQFQEVIFEPSFKDQIYFVYLDKKQDSKKGIQYYREQTRITTKHIEKISAISTLLLQSKTLQEFEGLLRKHENIIADLLNFQKVQNLYFENYWGVIKSLGAWGGDFVLVTSNRSYAKTKDYFNEKGFQVFLKYEDLILS